MDKDDVIVYLSWQVNILKELLVSKETVINNIYSKCAEAM